jgi:hypothetical protein
MRKAEMNAARNTHPKGRREGERVRNGHSLDKHSTVRRYDKIHEPPTVYDVDSGLLLLNCRLCIERKLPLLALAIGWQSSRINEKNHTTQHVTG